MDMSKLPRLSNTQESQNQQQTAGDPAPAPRAQAPVPVTSAQVDPATFGSAEVWLSAVLGVAFMYFGRTFGSYLLARLRGQEYDTHVTWLEGDRAGQMVKYWELSGFTALTDAGIFLFGLTMVVEAVAMIAIQRMGTRGARFVALAFAVTVIATVFNLFVVMRLFSAGITPMISLLAVAFGGYIAMYQWQWLKSLRARSA